MAMTQRGVPRLFELQPRESGDSMRNVEHELHLVAAEGRAKNLCVPATPREPSPSKFATLQPNEMRMCVLSREAAQFNSRGRQPAEQLPIKRNSPEGAEEPHSNVQKAPVAIRASTIVPPLRGSAAVPVTNPTG